jgi:hypothetical protein
LLVAGFTFSDAFARPGFAGLSFADLAGAVFFRLEGGRGIAFWLRLSALKSKPEPACL